MKAIRIISVIALAMLCRPVAQPQDTGSPSSNTLTLLPGKVLFTPLVASAQEPRTGLRKEIGSSRMKLDIGTTMDLLQVTTSNTHVLRMGIDFFTYALSLSNNGLRLQIAAVDGFFGGHITWSPSEEITGMQLRLRLLHLSAHLIDGSYDTDTGRWKDNRLPIPYTRDFGELIAAYRGQSRSIHFRVYAGFSYATLVRPSAIERFGLLAGLEGHSTDYPGLLLGTPSTIYMAYHFLLSGAPAYTPHHSVEAGIKIGPWASHGVRIYLSYDQGPEVFSQFYDLRRTAWGLGFAFDFW
jgi:hypothetical protein